VTKPQQSRLQGFAVHKAQHEQLRGGRILNHSGHQALHFVEVDLHGSLRLFPSTPSLELRNRNKNPAAARIASAGLDFGLVLFVSYPPSSADTLTVW
jgi:hypothetical protein